MIRSEQLRMARAGLGWTLSELARRSGVNPNTISRFEGGAQILSGKLAKLEESLEKEGVRFLNEPAGFGVILPVKKSTKSRR